jgi:hypothetical protein
VITKLILTSIEADNNIFCDVRKSASVRKETVHTHNIKETVHTHNIHACTPPVFLLSTSIYTSNTYIKQERLSEPRGCLHSHGVDLSDQHSGIINKTGYVDAVF